MAKNKREIIAEAIEAGNATKESLMEIAEVNAAGLSSQFTYLRLTGRYPVKGDGDVFKFISEDEWNEMKEAAASRKVSGGPKKSPEERKEALEKRVAKLQVAFDKAQEAVEKDDSEVNQLKFQKADAEVRLALISLDTVETELGGDDEQAEDAAE